MRPESPPPTTMVIRVEVPMNERCTGVPRWVPDAVRRHAAVHSDPAVVVQAHRRDASMSDIQWMVEAMFTDVAAMLGTRQLALLSSGDKREAIQMLDRHGIFETRNAVGRLMAEFQVSKATVYAYARRPPSKGLDR